MAPAVVRADYDQLAKMAAQFAQQAEQSRRLLQQVCREQDTLQRGDWLGLGAQGFYSEMGAQVVPTLKRLVRALEAASTTTLQIRQVMQAAEEEAARCLRANGSGAAPGGAPAGAPATGASGNGNGSSAGAAASAGASIKGSVIPDSPFTRALKPMAPGDMAQQLLGLHGQVNPLVTMLAGGGAFPQALKWTGGLTKFMAGPFNKFSKGMTVIDISKGIHKIATDGADPQTVADIVFNSATLLPGPAGLVGSAAAGGYELGKYINNKLGLSDKISDFLVGDRRVYSTRTFVGEYVRTHGTPAEQAAYQEWRSNYNQQRTTAGQAGQAAPPFRPPDLAVLKKVDPAILRMAETNRDIPAVYYDMSLKNARIPPFVRNAVLK